MSCCMRSTLIKTLGFELIANEDFVAGISFAILFFMIGGTAGACLVIDLRGFRTIQTDACELVLQLVRKGSGQHHNAPSGEPPRE